MRIYFLRHGIAAEKSVRAYLDDSERPLTREGKQEMRVIGKAMRRLSIGFDRIMSSPYLRSKQTADIVASEQEVSLKVIFSKNLVPGASSLDFLEEVRVMKEEFSSILVVGHEPFLSQCASLLLAPNSPPFLSIKKGGLCKVKIEHWDKTPHALLRWLLTPKQLVSIAHA